MAQRKRMRSSKDQKVIEQGLQEIKEWEEGRRHLRTREMVLEIPSREVANAIIEKSMPGTKVH